MIMRTKVTVYNWQKRNVGNAKRFEVSVRIVTVLNPEATCSLDITDAEGKTMRLHFAQKDFFALQEEINAGARRIVDIVNNS